MNTKDEFHEMYSSLPERIREASGADSTIRALGDIGKKYRLHVDQTGSLSYLVGQVFFGELKPDHFALKLADMLEISHTMANEITKDVNDAIFLPIQRELHELYSREKNEILETIEDTGVVRSPITAVAVEPSEATPDRDDLLRQIESPDETPSVARPVAPAAVTEEVIEQPIIFEAPRQSASQTIFAEDAPPPAIPPPAPPVAPQPQGVAPAYQPPQPPQPTQLAQTPSYQPSQPAQTVPAPSILERKRTEPFDPQQIAKERINRDPYKESV